MLNVLHWFMLLALALQVQSPPTWSSARTKQESNASVARAMRSVQSGVTRAAADPNRPVFHYRPPAFWMNDPNGPIFHEGFLHLFYQHNPYGDQWGSIHWGHAVSRDMVYWEDLPIALWPSQKQGEEHCFSGSAWINHRGQPMLFYTSVSENRPNQQWAALGGRNLITWAKHPDNPILALETHGGPQFEGSWRDPFLFAEGDRLFLVLGAREGDQALIPIYEATDGKLEKWDYRGILFQKPLNEVAFFECPNFFKLDGKWLLLYSPYRPVEYAVGSFDVEKFRFNPETTGTLDHGSGESSNFYASNVAFDARGNCILFGWVRGFREGVGWNGCLALPRLLSIGSDNRPRQLPIPQLGDLRRELREFSELTLEDETLPLEGIEWDTLELKAELELDTASAVGLRLQSTPGKPVVTIQWSGDSLDVAGTRVGLDRQAGQSPLALHLFLDKTVLEVFINDGQETVTRVIYLETETPRLEAYSTGGSASLRSVQIWRLDRIWPE